MEKLKAAFWPFVGGILIGMAILSFGFGFMHPDTAADQTADAVEDATVAFYGPQCLPSAQADPAQVASILEETSYRQRNAVSNTGWVTYPEGANASLKRQIDEACLAAIRSADIQTATVVPAETDG